MKTKFVAVAICMAQCELPSQLARKSDALLPAARGPLVHEPAFYPGHSESVDAPQSGVDAALCRRTPYGAGPYGVRWQSPASGAACGERSRTKLDGDTAFDTAFKVSHLVHGPDARANYIGFQQQVPFASGLLDRRQAPKALEG